MGVVLLEAKGRGMGEELWEEGQHLRYNSLKKEIMGSFWLGADFVPTTHVA